MKKVLNVLGYILLFVSLLLSPYLYAIFMLMFHDFVKILILIILLITVIVNVVHFKNTKIKYLGIRILITMVIVIVSSIAIYIGYGEIKNIQARNISKTIDKIVFESGYEMDGKKLENNLEFIKDKFVICKGVNDATIYYKDGTVEKTKAYNPFYDMIDIKGDRYYIIQNFE